MIIHVGPSLVDIDDILLLNIMYLLIKNRASFIRNTVLP